MTQQINRRTVTKGIAWSVPAVAIAGAAPAFADSLPHPPKVKLDKGRKIPGNSCGYAGSVKLFVTWVTFTNDSALPIYVFPDTLTYDFYQPNTDTPLGITFSYIGGTQPIRLEPGESKTFLFAANSSNSGNFGADVVVGIKWGHEPTYAADPNDHGYTYTPRTYVYFENEDHQGLCELLYKSN